MITKYLGANIRRARESTGLSQDKLAAKMGIAQSTLSNYEAGKIEPQATALYALARATNNDDKPICWWFAPTTDRG